MIINMRRYRVTVAIMGMAVVILLVLGYSLWGRKHQAQPPGPQKDEACGEFLPWSEVNTLFPKYDIVWVTDYDTGMCFRMQRRGGSRHADVQPLTATDTLIMKKIYQDRWSWKRRAVIVQLANGRKIAGSMNGMPHGQGAIKGNNFNGHSCIHFRDSKTHGSRKVDLAHQLMVWKAAGVFAEQVKGMIPEDCIRVFFAALEQGDSRTAVRLAASQKAADEVAERLKRADSIKIQSIKKDDNSRFRVELLIVYQGSNRQQLQPVLVTTHGSGEGSLIEFVLL